MMMISNNTNDKYYKQIARVENANSLKIKQTAIYQHCRYWHTYGRYNKVWA